eukprot:1157499-Pelagomonas_calceolata.AAC.7
MFITSTETGRHFNNLPRQVRMRLIGGQVHLWIEQPCSSLQPKLAVCNSNDFLSQVGMWLIGGQPRLELGTMLLSRAGSLGVKPCSRARAELNKNGGCMRNVTGRPLKL